MRYLKRSAMMLVLMILLFGATVISTEAQRRVYRRPVIVYHYPHWGPGFGWGYNRYWYDPYYAERERRDYLERSVRGNRSELQKHRDKYYADGVLTEKERRELADDEKDYQKSLRRLRDYNDD